MSRVEVWSCFLSLANAVPVLADGTVVDCPQLVTRGVFSTPASAGQGREYDKNLSWVNMISREISHLLSRKQKSRLGESNLIYCQLLVTEEESMK